MLYEQILKAFSLSEAQYATLLNPRLNKCTEQEMANLQQRGLLQDGRVTPLGDTFVLAMQQFGWKP